MAVSIHEMERTISNFPDSGLGSDLGNTIDVSDVTDDLGMNFLANTKFMSGNQNNISVNRQQSSYNTVNVQPISSALEEVEFTKLEPMQPINIDTSPSQMPTITIQREDSSSSGVKYETFGNSSGPSINFSTSSSQQESLPTMISPPIDLEEERKKKSDLINKLQRSTGLPKAGLKSVKSNTKDLA